MTPANKNYLGVGLAGLAIIVFWIFGMPAWDRVSLLNGATAEREDILSSRTEILKKIEDLNSQYQQRSSDVSKISSVVPNAKGAAELVSTVEAGTPQTGLQLIDVFEWSASQASIPGQQIVLNFRVKANAYYLKLNR